MVLPAWLSTTFQTAGVQTAPRVFLVPQGYGFPTARNLGEFEVTQGMSRSDGSVDDFLHDLGAITGAKVRQIDGTSLEVETETEREWDKDRRP